MAPDRVTLKILVKYLCRKLPLNFYQVKALTLLSQLEAQESTGMLEEDEEVRSRYLGRLEEVSVLGSTREFCRSLDLETELNTVVEY